MTTWRLMVAVAVVALILAGMDMGIRSMRYRRKADHYGRIERRCREIVAMDPPRRAREAEAAYDDPFLDNPEWSGMMIRYCGELKAKYDHAAEHPWIQVPPDPLPP